MCDKYLSSRFKSDHLKSLGDNIPKSKTNGKMRLKILLDFIVVKYGLIVPFDEEE